MIYPHQVTVIRPASSTDRYGNPVPDWANATSRVAAGWVQQRTQLTASGETDDQTGGRVAVVTGWVLFLPAGTDIEPTDRVEWNQVVFDLEVDARPNELWSPRGPHHMEVRLRTVEG